MQKEYIYLVPRYVGVCDFTQEEQAIKMRDVLAKACKGMNVPPVLMVGIMISFKTLWNIPSQWDGVFPLKDRLPKIFPAYDAGVLNTLHYADFHDPAGWPDEQNLFYSLSKAMDCAGPNLHAIQLDMTWPDPGMIASAIHAQRRPIGVVLQVGRQAFEEVNSDPIRVADRLGDY